MSLDNVFFSVILCTYNRDYIIEWAINSFLKQTFANSELIIVDDCGTDNTFEIAKKYIQKHNNIKYIYKHKTSLGFTRNCGIRASGGRYITFLDSDDEYKSDHLEKHFEILNNSYIELLNGTCEIIGNQYVPDAEKIGEVIHLNDCVIGGTFFIRKDVFQKIGYFKDISFGDDLEFYNRAKSKNIKISKSDFQTYIYYRNMQDSICNNII